MNNQLTLRNLINKLKQMPAHAQVPNLSNPHSYRGYYDDLAFELEAGTTTAFELRCICEKVRGTHLTGYKGGEFFMSDATPVWIAVHSFEGERLVNIGKDLINGIYKIRVATDAEKIANRDLYTAFSKSLHNRTRTRYNVTNAEGVSMQFETLVSVADYIKRPRSTVTPAMYRKYELNGFTIEKVTV